MASPLKMEGIGNGKAHLPLHTCHVDPYVHIYRAHAAIYALSLLALFYHHCLHLLASTTFLSFSISLTLFVADAVLAFMWLLSQSYRWRPVHRQVFPERLPAMVDEKDFPALDVFICTADSYKEPPMGVVNTALSAMAFDYPADKLSVYISDDGWSELTLFAFMEATRFAAHWLPFCRENGIQERCPEAYFRSKASGSHHEEEIQLLYQRMKRKVESVLEGGHVDKEVLLSKEEHEAFSKWATGSFSRHQHPSVVQVLLESSKDKDVTHNPLPNLVYVSREKNKGFSHHFKAGALNVLLKVSSIMTNAPIILTLDCDTISNDSKTPQQALCYMLDQDLAGKLAFVQYPQRFHGINRDDIYGSEMRAVTVYLQGMDGLRGPGYDGTGTFFSRRALCSNNLPSSMHVNGSLKCEHVLRKAHQVASCTYEHGTKWGSTMGFRYGTIAEDFFTGLCLLCEGWISVFCNPERPAFLGEAPISLNDTLSQIKRWCVGPLEVALSEYCPLTFGVKKASLLVGMGYSHFAFLGFWSIPIFTYGILPQIALLYQLPIFPKALDRWFFLYCYLFFAAYARHLMEFLRAGGNIRKWWNDQRMWMIHGVTCFPFSLLEFSFKRLGFSTAEFNVTAKLRDDDQNHRYEKGMFEFGVSSPFVVSLGTFAIVNFTSFTVGFARALSKGVVRDLGLQLFLSAYLVVNCWPIYEAMVFRKDGGRIPIKCTVVSLLITGVIHTIAYPIFGIGDDLQGET